MITAEHKGKMYDVEYSIVNVSELEKGLRIDAEYYEQCYMYDTNKITMHNFSSLKDLQKVPIINGFDYREFIHDGIPYIRVGDIKNFAIDLNNCVYVKPKIIPNKIALEKDDILLTRKGTVGEIATIHSEDLKKLIISSEIMRIRIDRGKINPYFVAVSLYSYFGRIQIVQALHGIAHVSITQDALENVKIPIPSDAFQKQIENLALKAYEEREKVEKLYKQAEDILLEELGLNNWKPKTKKVKIGGKEFEEEENISIRNLSEVAKADRLDAEYWEPKYDEMIKKLIGNYKTEKLKNIASFINHGKQPYYVENGEVPILTQKHLGAQLLSLYSEIINMPDTPRTDRGFSKIYPEYLLRAGDVLFYSVGAYLGRTNAVLEDLEGVPASFITLIRTIQEICNPIYLALFLNSKIGQLQSEKWKSASAQQYIYPKEIKEFIIPILPPETQQKLASLIQQSHEARKKSKKLLEIAKRAVEIAIEKNEKEALSYISKIENKQ
jgi:hypothetical protein